MLVKLLRDLARAIAEGTGSDQLEAATRRAEEMAEARGDEGVQKGAPEPLPPAKAARLSAASTRREVVDPRKVVGGKLDQLS